MQMVRLDEKTRTVWFQAQGRERGEDPYFRHYYRIGLDGTGYTPLTPIPGDHAVQLSPSGRYLIDTYSQPDVEPAVALRDGSGKFAMMLEKADISKLRAMGWKPPMPITMKARDGKTDIYGLLFRPTTFDPARKYPIVNHVYPGPQTGSTGSRAFAAARSDRQALAELGFIVVTIDGMGTPGRSKAFQDAYYGAMGRDNTIPDQIAGMKELAARYPWIDLDRAGIWGHSGGGFATTTAMFRFPDFFKAGIAESGNHDQRLNEDDWGERYQGLVTKNADGTDSYAAEANQNFAKNLKGHLLLAHGTMDTNVPPYQTMLIADALIKANKDFDLLMLPNQNHGFGSASAYMMRRRWDYFVKHLVGQEPPREYEMQPQPRPVAPPPPPAPTKADLLRGAYGPLSRQQRPALLSPRYPRRPREEVDRRQEHDPLPDAEGRHAHPARSDGYAERRQDPARRDAAEVRAGFRRRLRRLPRHAQAGPGLRDRLLLLGQSEGDRALRRDRVPQGPRRPPLDQHRVPGHRRQRLVAEQGSAPGRSRRHADQRRDPE